MKREALRVLFGGKTDVPTAATRMRERLGWSPSPSTVKRALFGAPQGIRTPQAPSRGTFLGDEKCVRGKGARLSAPLSDPWKRYLRVAHRLPLPHLFSPLHLLKIRSDHLHIYLSNKRWGMTTHGRKRKKGRIGVHFPTFCNKKRPARYLRALRRGPQPQPPAEVRQPPPPPREEILHLAPRGALRGSRSGAPPGPAASSRLNGRGGEEGGDLLDGKGLPTERGPGRALLDAEHRGRGGQALRVP